ncbi:hypothetical protein ACYOEI_30960, partial [Singulisphaera rosea]
MMYGKSEDSADYQHTAGPLAAMAVDFPDGTSGPPHDHRRAQLIYSRFGGDGERGRAGAMDRPPFAGDPDAGGGRALDP